MACLEERGGQISHLHPQTIRPGPFDDKLASQDLAVLQQPRKRVQSLSQPQDGEKRSDNPRGSFAPGRQERFL